MHDGQPVGWNPSSASIASQSWPRCPVLAAALSELPGRLDSRDAG